MTTITAFTPNNLPTYIATQTLELLSLRAPEQSSQTSIKEKFSINTSIQALDEQALLAEISHGTELAMEEFYLRYYKLAYALAYRILHDNTLAEDIIQDAFLSVWRKAASYQEQQGSVRSWLLAIVHHRAIDRVRAASHRDAQWTSLQADNQQDLPTETPEVWEEAWHNERDALVRNVLAQLPAEQRQVIELGYFAGYTHSEIAERWHIPLGTVKGRMRLGLQKMKHLLREHGLDTAW